MRWAGTEIQQTQLISGAQEGGVWEVGILVRAKYSAELLELHQCVGEGELSS